MVRKKLSWMKKGDIVLIEFPFTNLSGAKSRPALILMDFEFDVILAFITTQLKWYEEDNIQLKPTTDLKKFLSLDSIN